MTVCGRSATGMRVVFVCFFILFLDGGHSFLGGVVQVFCGRDGQAALGQNPFGLVDVGPWQTQENAVITRDDKGDKNWPNKAEPRSAICTDVKPHCVKDKDFLWRNPCSS